MEQPKVAYKFVRDEREFYCNWHGWLEAYEDEILVAREEKNYLVKDWEIARLQAHQPKPGHMIPWGDPRWQTHCQECGKKVDPQRSAYLGGQYHYPECYRVALPRQSNRYALLGE